MIYKCKCKLKIFKNLYLLTLVYNFKLSGFQLLFLKIKWWKVFQHFRKPGHRSITIKMDKKIVNSKACSIEVTAVSIDIMKKICDHIPITKQMYDELLPNPMKPYRRMAGM